MKSGDVKRRFDRLQREAENAFSRGDLRQAVELFGAAEDLALEGKRRDLAERAFCNRCAVLIELDEAAAEIPRLRSLVLSSKDRRTRWMASYYTAVAYDLEGESERALHYSRRARELAAELADPALSARVANLSGTLSLRASDFAAAETAYREAIAAHRHLDGYHRIYEAVAQDNLGYVLMCSDRLEDGLELCEQARTALESLDGGHGLAQALQDLCYGYVLVDELERAQQCGEQALALALASNESLIVKNALFLLSEAAVRRGDTFRARRYLRELAEHYPEVAVSEEIIDIFLVTDLTSVVNLRG